jgi:hypothetical protein
MEQKLIHNILQKLDKPYGYVAKTKRGKSPEILLGDFIKIIIVNDVSSKKAKEYLNISEQTFTRILRKILPDIRLQGGGQSWAYYFLSLIEYKKCNACRSILSLENFSTHHSICKNCRHEYNTSEDRQKANRENQKVYYSHNKKYFYEKTARYKAQLLKACPKWTNLDEIRKIYDNCPKGYHVDHIIPLRGKYVCGLHIPINLQYLSITDNCSKNNYHESEEFW